VKYCGFKADVFALGVALFLLVNGFPPYYNKASGNDPYYKFFVEGKQVIYWQILLKKFKKSYSDEFKDLIN